MPRTFEVSRTTTMTLRRIGHSVRILLGHPLPFAEEQSAISDQKLNRLTSRPLNSAFACPACGEAVTIVPHALRSGQNGRTYDLWSCLACTAVINATDLCAVGQPVTTVQSESAANFYRPTPEVIKALPNEVAQNRNLIQFLLEHCPDLGRSALLDFGAGRGCLAAAATEVFDLALASELDLTMLNEFLPHLPNNERIRLVSDPRMLPPLDAIAAFHVLEHLPDVKRVLGPVVAALQPGGALFFQVPLLRSDYLLNTHYTFFSEASARAACSRLGLDVVGVWYDQALDFLTCIARRPR